MAIPDSQLLTWTAQGSVKESRDTYATIRGVLEDSKAPYAGKKFDIFLQGSYANDTNVWRDSDVDIVIKLDDMYYSDATELGEVAKANRQRAFVKASYGFDDFRKDVLSWLQSNYGSLVDPGNNAITIKGSGNRRDADVLVCCDFRKYRSDSSGTDEKYHQGICYWRPDHTQIINYPKQHSDNCTSKHQNASNRLKPMVRIWKNLRNRMVDEKVIPDKLAPSYFIEGMLYNVPSERFVASRVDTFTGAFGWINNADQEKLVCANELYYLVHPSSAVTWRIEKLKQFMSSVRTYWQNWK